MEERQGEKKPNINRRTRPATCVGESQRALDLYVLRHGDDERPSERMGLDSRGHSAKILDPQRESRPRWLSPPPSLSPLPPVRQLDFHFRHWRGCGDGNENECLPEDNQEDENEEEEEKYFCCSGKSVQSSGRCVGGCGFDDYFHNVPSPSALNQLTLPFSSFLALINQSCSRPSLPCSHPLPFPTPSLPPSVFLITPPHQRHIPYRIPPMPGPRGLAYYSNSDSLKQVREMASCDYMEERITVLRPDSPAHCSG